MLVFAGPDQTPCGPDQQNSGPQSHDRCKWPIFEVLSKSSAPNNIIDLCLIYALL